MSAPERTCAWRCIGLIEQGKRWRSQCGHKSDCSSNWTPASEVHCWYCGGRIVAGDTEGET